MSETVQQVNDGNFEEQVLQSEKPVLVDFWAPWCPPCRMIAPVIAELAKEYEGRAKVVKLDVDESPAVAGKYGIQGIPTLLVFKAGRVVEQRVGALPKTELARMLDAHAIAPAPSRA